MEQSKNNKNNNMPGNDSVPESIMVGVGEKPDLTNKGQKKPFYLSFEDVDFYKLEDSERLKLCDEFNARRAAFKEEQGSALNQEELDLFDIENTQQMLREALSIVRPREVEKDFYGLYILSPEEYLDAIQNLEPNSKHRFDSTISAPITLERNGKPHQVQVDMGIANYLQRMANAGFATGQSDSGMLRDHPNYRYVSDDEHGRFVKGECINYGKQGSGAYLTFWKPEADLVKQIGDRTNSEEQIALIRRTAKEIGWECSDMLIFGQPSVRLAPPFTYDGSFRQDIIREANDRTNILYPGLHETDFLDWLEKRSAIEIKVQNDHGGVIRYTDLMLSKQWDVLTTKLEMGMKHIVQQNGGVENMRYPDGSLTDDALYERALRRITDVRITPPENGKQSVICKIDGRQQMSRIIQPENRGWSDKMMVAARTYRDVLEDQDIHRNKCMNL